MAPGVMLGYRWLWPKEKLLGLWGLFSVPCLPAQGAAFTVHLETLTLWKEMSSRRHWRQSLDFNNPAASTHGFSSSILSAVYKLQGQFNFSTSWHWCGTRKILRNSLSQQTLTGGVRVREDEGVTDLATYSPPRLLWPCLDFRTSLAYFQGFCNSHGSSAWTPHYTLLMANECLCHPCCHGFLPGSACISTSDGRLSFLWIASQFHAPTIKASKLTPCQE